MTAEDKMLAALRRVLWGFAIAVIVVIGLAVLIASKAFGHDHNHPERNEYLKSLHSKNKTWCCNGDDYDSFDDWEAREGGYRVKFRGQWFDVPDGAVIGEPNRIGEALLWMNKGISGLSVRCFLPGALT